MTEKRNASNLLDLLSLKARGTVYPTVDFYRLTQSNLNHTSELASTVPNKHVYGSGEYGHLFVSAGFPSFGTLYPYTTIENVLVYDNVSEVLKYSKSLTVHNSSNVNVIRIRGGQQRSKVVLVDNNYSDISNIEYGLGGIIDSSMIHNSPLGLDYNWTSRNREYWQDTDQDYTAFVPVVNTSYENYIPLYVVGNDRPFLYDTRLSLYSGTFFYKQAFGVRVFVKVYRLGVNKEVWTSQHSVANPNNDVLQYNELELVDSFKILREEIDNPKVGLLRYNSPPITDRKRLADVTDTLTLYLGDYYEKGEVWDPLYGKKVKIKDLDIDIIVTVDTHRSSLQPEIVGILRDSVFSTEFGIENIDILNKSNLTQQDVVQLFEPSSFAYFANKGSFFSRNEGDTQTIPPVGYEDFPLCGSFKISHVFPKNTPSGVSANKRTMMSPTTLRVDTSNATGTIIPPPIFINVRSTENPQNKVPYAYAVAEEDDASNFEFRINLNAGPVTLNDGTTYLNRYTGSSLGYTTRFHCGPFFREVLSQVAEDTDTGSTDPNNYYMQYKIWDFVTHVNPFDEDEDAVWYPSVDDMARVMHGEVLTDWSYHAGSHVVNPYDASNDFYFKDSGGGSHEYHNANNVLHWAYRMGNSCCFPKVNPNWGDCLNNSFVSWATNASGYPSGEPRQPNDATNMTRYDYNDFLWIPYFYVSADKPSNPAVLKQFHHLVSPDRNKVFNQHHTTEYIQANLCNLTKVNASGTAYLTNTDELSMYYLPIEDLLYLYWKESSNVLSITHDETNNRILINVNLTWGTYPAPGWRSKFGTSGDRDPTNLVNFCGNISEGDYLTFYGPYAISQVYFKRNIKVLPDLKKIVYVYNDQRWISLVEDFIRGNKLISGVNPRAAMATIFGKTEEQLASLTIEELFNPDSFFYRGRETVTKYNANFGWYLLLWQAYLYYNYPEIYANLDSFYKLRVYDEMDSNTWFYYPSGGGVAAGAYSLEDLEILLTGIPAGSFRNLYPMNLFAIAALIGSHDTWASKW